MEGFTKSGKVVGVVIDVTDRLDDTGRRTVDTVRKALIEIVKKGLEDDVDCFYLYHPEIVELTYRHGDQFSAIGNYETDGYRFDLRQALKQTLYVIGSEDYDLQKYLILISDRIEDDVALRKVIQLNRKDMFDIHFIFVGIGNGYSKKALDVASKLGEEDQSVTCLYLKNASELPSLLLKEKENGTEDLCCSSS
jgi:hypothetical protein